MNPFNASKNNDVEWRHDHNFKPLFEGRGRDDQNKAF